MSDFTIVVTSSGRHDLLEQTLQSFQQFADETALETIIVEDGPTEKPAWLVRGAFPRLGEVTWIGNGVTRGQVYSIDTAYERVKTPYIFHCEDDWGFSGGSRFIADSQEILEKYPEILQVLLGNYNAHPVERLPEYPFETKVWNWREAWSGFSWNPGLRRKSDWNMIGSYGRHVGYGEAGLGPECSLTSLYRDLGFRVACLPKVSVRHIGDTRSVARQAHKIPEKTLIIIPACHEYQYGSWQSDVHRDGHIQIGRLGSVRDTWSRDVAPHTPYLDYKFFFGRGANRQPLPDEVFLDVEDGYSFLPLKCSAAYRWARENGYKRVYKCDDDTYVWVDRLVRDMLSPRWEDEQYYGYRHLHGYVTGGAGYVLNGRAFTIMGTTKPVDYDHWAEDISTYKILERKGNISGVYNPGHQPGHSAHWFDTSLIDSAGTTVLGNVQGLPNPGDRVALRAIHAVKIEDMHELYSRWLPVAKREAVAA